MSGNARISIRQPRFIDLLDAPDSYSGEADRLVSVKSDESGLEFIDAIFSSSVTSVFGRTGDVVALANDYTWAKIDKTVSNLSDITTKSHLVLSDVGTNTHVQIDSHLSSTSNPHAVTAAQTSAVALTGDETIAGIKTFSSLPECSTTATTANQLTNFATVSALLQGITSLQPAVRLASTVAGTLATDFENGDLLDGVALATNDRILIKNQASGAENGIYVVAASGAPARAADFDSTAECNQGATVAVLEGDTQVNTLWVQVTLDPVIGVDSLVFHQLPSPASMTASNGVKVVANDVQIDLSDTNPSLEVSDGGLRAKVDGASIERSASGLEVKALGITNAMLAGSIADSKLSQITTASKVSGAALTSLASIPSGAGIVPVANLGSGSPDATNYLRGDGSWQVVSGGGGTTTIYYSKIINTETSTVTVSNTTAETTIYSFSIPANTLSTDKMLRLTIQGTYQNNSGSNRICNFKMKYGATTVTSKNSGNIGSNAGTGYFTASFLLGAGGATNLQNGFENIVIESGNGTSVGITDNGKSAEDSTAAKTLTITFTHSFAAATIVLVKQNAILELVNASDTIGSGGGSGGIISLNGLTAVTQTFANGSTGTAPAFVSATSTHTLNIPMASAAGVTAGLLNKIDYDIFNAKQPAGSYLTEVISDSPLSGSGTSASHLTVDLSGRIATTFLGIGSLTDPNANALWGWDDTDGAVKNILIGANLSYDHASHTLSATGGGGMVYPGVGIALSTGSAWDTSITNNSANWNTAYGWGNHASAGYLTSVTAHNLLSTTHGDTTAASCARGSLIVGDSNTKWVAYAKGTTGKFLTTDANDTIWSTLTLPNSGTAYKLPVFTGTNAMGELTVVGATGEYLAGATGAIPAWATLNQAAIDGLTTAASPTFVGLNLTGNSNQIVLNSDGGVAALTLTGVSATSAKTITFPNTTGTVYVSSGTDVVVADGGTNKSSWTQYCIPYLSATTTFSEIAIGTAGQALVVNGSANGYAWSSAILVNPMSAVGDIIYGGASGTPTRLADVAVASYLRSGGVTTAPLWSTLKLPNTATANYVPYATSTNTIGEGVGLQFSGTYLKATAGIFGNDSTVITATQNLRVSNASADSGVEYYTAGPTTATATTICGTGSNIVGAGTDWTNPTYIQIDDTNYATSGGSGASGGSGTTDVLRASNFGFAIPTDAIILGVTVIFNRCGNGSPGFSVSDNSVYLFDHTGTGFGTNKAGEVTWSLAALRDDTYGSATDMWGLTTASLTPAIINDVDFGVGLSANYSWTGGGASTPTVDYVKIIINYALPQTWTVGIDQSAQEFSISRSSAIGTNPMLTFPRAGNIVAYTNIIANSAASVNLGSDTNYFNTIYYKTATDKGCIPFWDEDAAYEIISNLKTDVKRKVDAPSYKEKGFHNVSRLDYSRFPAPIYDSALELSTEELIHPTTNEVIPAGTLTRLRKVIKEDGSFEIKEAMEGLDIGGLIGLLLASHRKNIKKVKELENRITILERG